MLEEKVPEDLELHITDPEEQEPEEKPNEELVLTPSMEKKESDEELVLTPSTEKEESDEELTLTPSPEEAEESEELTLEADRIYKASEITFEGEEASEERVEKAMEEYDAAMDDAAGKSR